jgi:hypothetical protein
MIAQSLLILTDIGHAGTVPTPLREADTLTAIQNVKEELRFRYYVEARSRVHYGGHMTRDER